MAYSMEYRRAVAKAYDECGSSIEVADQFGCSESWVRRLIQRRRETGSLEPRPIKLPHNNKLDDDDLEQLAGFVAGCWSWRWANWQQRRRPKVSVPTVWRATQTLGLVLKKSPSSPPSRIVPTSKRHGRGGSSSSRM